MKPLQMEPIKLKRLNLHEQIAENIQNMILRDNLLPGTRLPPERQLAEIFGVNRTTLREAIRLLEQWGLVEMKVGSGTYIREIPHSVVADSLQRFFLFKSCSYEDLMGLREILEPEIAALAAKHADLDATSNIRQALEVLEEAFLNQDAIAYAEADTDFHEAIAVAARNELVLVNIRALHHVLKNWIKRNIREYVWHRDSVLSHRAVYEAIENRDPEAAKQSMIHHMELARTGHQPQNRMHDAKNDRTRTRPMRKKSLSKG